MTPFDLGGPFSVLILDNARIHHGEEILELAERFSEFLLVSVHSEFSTTLHRCPDLLSTTILSRPEPNRRSIFEDQGFYSSEQRYLSC